MALMPSPLNSVEAPKGIVLESSACAYGNAVYALVIDTKQLLD